MLGFYFVTCITHGKESVNYLIKWLMRLVGCWLGGAPPSHPMTRLQLHSPLPASFSSTKLPQSIFILRKLFRSILPSYIHLSAKNPQCLKKTLALQSLKFKPILAISDMAILGEIGHFQLCRKWPKSKTRTDFSASNHQGGHQQLSRWVRTKSFLPNTNRVGKCKIFYTDQYRQNWFFPEKSA